MVKVRTVTVLRKREDWHNFSINDNVTPDKIEKTTTGKEIDLEQKVNNRASK